MADRLAGGSLPAKIRALRDDGLSWEAVAGRLYADHGIEVTAQTLRTWGRDLGFSEAVAS